MTTQTLAGVRSGRSRRRLAAALLAMLLAITGLVDGDLVESADANAVVFVNAVVGPESVDIYLNGSLVAGSVPFGTAAGPFALPGQVDHDVELFAAVASPPATPGARSDEPLEASRVDSQPRNGAFFDLDAPTLVRLANSTPDSRWFAFAQDMPIAGGDCDPDFARIEIDGAADIFFSMPGIGGGSGVFGVGGVALSSSAPWTQDVVVLADRLSIPGVDPNEFVGGSYNFGSVDFAVGQSRAYMVVGHNGSYRALEFVLDCVTQRVVSTRSVGPSPTFAPSRFVPLAPSRLFDTRESPAPFGPIPAGGQIDVPVAGNAGVPATGVSAVVMNVTATQASARGHVRVWPQGSERPSTANLNIPAAGATIANLVTVPVGDDGGVSFFALSQTHLVADVMGYFVEADSATAGRFVPLEPTRAFDTRTPAAPNGAVAPDGTLTVEMAGRAGIPDDGASAVVVNLTGVDTGARGFVTAYPGGVSRPTAASLNLAGGFDTAPNLAIIPLGDDGTISFYAKGGAHLIADVFGYFTDESAASSDVGLFVPTTPTRIRDSRSHPLRAGFVDPIAPGTDYFVPVAGVGSIPGTGASAVLANLTGTQATARGFMTAYPDGSDRPEAANLNLLSAGATRPNAILVPVGGLGDLRVFTLSGGHVIVDAFGYFTG